MAASKPRAFALPLCRRLGLGPGAHAGVVGSRRHDVEGAHANGSRCVGALWAIGLRSGLEDAGADTNVARPSELPCALGL